MEAQQNALEVALALLKLVQEGPRIIRFSCNTSFEVFFWGGEETDFFLYSFE
jgi:hypothetical protein